MQNNFSTADRVRNSLKTQFIADALAMPVHWFYNQMDIEKAFPGGIQRFEAAPEFHPSSIMSLHSTSSGGRRARHRHKAEPQIVGDVILKGRAQFWNVPNVHYHQGMAAGENTLNAHCSRVLMRCLADDKGHYRAQTFLPAYIGFMTADPPAHSDTYAESYHRGFFANLAKGLPPEQCAMKTHDTPSIGGLVTIAPLVFSERLRGTEMPDIQALCREHLALTHPDETLMQVCDRYVNLLCGLMEGPDEEGIKALLSEAGKGSVGLDVAALVKRNLPDNQVVGRMYSPACYISDSWPVVLYLAYKYRNDPWLALRVNTNLGGDNVHRGMVLGALLGLISNDVASRWFDQLVDHEEIGRECFKLMNENIKTRGPAVRAEQLIDIYQARLDVPSPWTVISDQVMGGVSSAALQQDDHHSSPCTCLTGRTRLDNNGGFVQMKLEMEPGWSCANYRGLFIELCGAAHDYNLHVKTNQLDKPWQSFRCTLPVEPQWTRFIVPYGQLLAHRTDAQLKPADIKSVAVVAIGSEFDVDVCVRRFGFFL